MTRAAAAWVAPPLALWVLAMGACACSEDAPISARAYPKAGLYTPGSKLGADLERDDAGSLDGSAGLSAEERRTLEESITQAGGQDRCAEVVGPEGTPGTLVAEFETASYGGFYEPANCGAVWIEDAAGAYVATLHLWAELRFRNLFVWDARRCKTQFPVDAVATATLADHSTPHVARWDGRDHTGKVAPDAKYVLNVEVTEDELNFGRRTEVSFDKGAEAFVIEPPDGETVKRLRVTYVPRGGAR